MQITPNFSRSEFDCKDGTKVPPEYMENLERLCKNLEVLREYVKKPVKISGSGYRTREHNENVGGVSRSLHLTAKAADISVEGCSGKALYNIIEQLIKSGRMEQGGLGMYDGWVHYDIRGNRARWRG